MFRRNALGVIVAVLAFSAGGAGIHASGNGRTLVVTMTNDPNANQIRVYDAESHFLLQTLSTYGKGGVGGGGPLASGGTRTFLEDGDEVIIRARAERDGFVSIGLGDVRGIVMPSDR